MPQMKPMYWMVLMLIFFMYYMIYFVIINFCSYLFKLEKSESDGKSMLEEWWVKW